MSSSTERTGSGRTRTVGVNLTWLVPGVVGGSEEYTVRLLEAAGPLLPDGLRLRLYGRAELVETHPGLAEHHEWVEAPVWPGGRLARVLQESTWLARRSRQDDLVHHAGGTVPFAGPGPTVVTVHDLQPLDMPENFGPVKRWWLGRSIPRAVRSAELVLCPSASAAGRIREVLGVPAERVRVVPHGHRAPVDVAVEPGHEGPAVAAVSRFGRYLLYPAIAYPHKRHGDLVELLARLGPERDDVALVLTGRPGPESGRIMAEAQRLGVEHRVHQLGRIPADELVALYRSAEALVFPSAYEGFGNPAVEAMSLGCPAVVSDAGALPEVVGSAGLIVPVGDVEAMAGAVGRILDDGALAEDLRRRGRERAAEFDVEIAAGRLVDVYRELVDPTGS